MKRFIVTLFAFVFCIGLCACGGSGTQSESYLAVPNNQQSVNDAPAVAATDPAECYENGSIRKEIIGDPDDGEYWVVEYFETGETSKVNYVNQTSGAYQDEEFYKNGNTCKKVGEDPATGKYWAEEYFEDGSFSKVISGNRTTGEYSEAEYYENGNIKRTVDDNPVTGDHWEWDYYEDGSPKLGIRSNQTTGVYIEEEFYENGKLKYQKQQYPSQIFEGRYDEEGYCTYQYSKMPMPGAKKGLYRTEECFADENGKLIKIILNGEVKDDPVWLAQQAPLHNFRE